MNKIYNINKATDSGTSAQGRKSISSNNNNNINQAKNNYKNNKKVNNNNGKEKINQATVSSNNNYKQDNNGKDMFCNNCVRIRFNPKDKIFVGRADIYEGFSFIENFDVKYIERVTQYRNNHTWIVAIKSDFKAECLIGREVTLCNKCVRIEEPMDVATYHCFKVMWMAPRFPMHQVSSFLQGGCQKSKVMSVKEITVKNEKFGDIPTGIYNVTIRYPDINNIKVPELSGIINICVEKLFITRYGEEPKCLYCNQHGHVKKTCPKFNIICVNCGKKGHDKCTMATKIMNNEHVEDFDDDIEVDNVNTNPANTNSNKQPTTKY